MNKTKIEWCERTWNPITGCTKISEGCKHCYAERMSKRLAGRCGYDKDEPFKVTLHPDKFDDPLRWKKPSKIFVCSMGDLFHEDVEDWMLDEIFGVILGSEIFSNTANHVFMILTKRPDQMHNYFTKREPVELLRAWANSCTWYTDDPDKTVEDLVYSATCHDWDETGRNSSGSEYKPWGYINKIWPLPNVWLGVTAENQQRADERIPMLLQIPAAKRFVSIEPMLGPVDLSHWLVCACDEYWPSQGHHPECPTQNLHWIICGGETGPGARPMHPDWVRSLRDQCQCAGTPFFFKSWGEYEYLRRGASDGDGKYFYNHVGKKNSGRLLDGEEWNEYPEGGQ